jgi:hypothetical protein
VTLKTTRRRRANSATSSDLEGIGTLGETDDHEDAMFEQKMASAGGSTANSSEDEEGRRATKRARHAQ